MITLTLKEAMDKQGMTRYRLSQLTGIQYAILDKYYKNTVIRYDSYVLDRICTALRCDISDLLKYTKS